MPKANLRVLESPAGPFHKAECSVCGEKFYLPAEARDFKADMLKQFDAHLQPTSPTMGCPAEETTAPQPGSMSEIGFITN
jgi:hypothetical protein